MKRTPARGGKADRGVSEVVGLTILIGIVAIGAVAVVLAGSTLIDTIQGESELESAEQSMASVNAELASLSTANGNETSQLPVSQGEANEITITNETEFTFRAIENGAPVANYTLYPGSITYRHEDGTRIASEAGGLWRIDDAGATMVSPPPLRYRNGSLSFEIVTAESLGDAGPGAVSARADQLASQEYTRELESQLFRSNGTDVMRDAIRLDVESPYGDAWSRYLSEQYGDDPRVAVSDTADGVTVEFELVANVAAGTSSGDPAVAINAWAGASSWHSFQHTLDASEASQLSGWDNIEVDYEGGDTSALTTDDVQYVGVDTDGDGLMDTTAEVDEVVNSINGHSGADTLTFDLDPSTLPAPEAGHTIMFQYGDGNDPNGPVVNPTNPGDDGVTVELSDGSDVVSYADSLGTGAGGDLRERPPAAQRPVSVASDGTLVLNATDATVEHLGTSFAQRPRQTNETRDPVDVVFVSDESGSMDDNDPNDRRPEATQQFIDNLADEPYDDRVATIHFSSYRAQSWDASDTRDAWLVEGLQDPEDVDASVQDDRANTNYHAGLYRAMEVLDEAGAEEDREQVIVFMGDGEHNAHTNVYRQDGNWENQYEPPRFPDPANVSALAREAGEQGVTIHTIGFSRGITEDAERLLRDRMAGQTGGIYVNETDPEDLEDAYDRIFSEVTEAEELGVIQHRQLSATAGINGERFVPDAAAGVWDDGTRSPTAPDFTGLYHPNETFTDQAVPGSETPDDAEAVVQDGESIGLDLTITDYGCGADANETGAATNISGTTYAHEVCEGATTPVADWSAGDVGYHVLTDGDDLPSGVDAQDWQRDLDDRLRSQGYLDGSDDVDVGPDRALVVVDLDADSTTGYAAFLVDAQADFALEPTDTPTPSEANPFVDIAVSQVQVDA